MKKPVRLLRRAIFKYILAIIYNSRYQRKSEEIPKSTTAKNTAITTTVDKTTIVYFVNSLRFGQLTFLISETTLLKNPLLLAI